MIEKLFTVPVYDMDAAPEELVAMSETLEDLVVTGNATNKEIKEFRYVQTHPIYVKYCLTPLELLEKVKHRYTLGREKFIPAIREYMTYLERLEAYEHCAALQGYIEKLKIEYNLLTDNNIKWAED